MKVEYWNLNVLLRTTHEGRDRQINLSLELRFLMSDLFFDLVYMRNSTNPLGYRAELILKNLLILAEQSPELLLQVGGESAGGREVRSVKGTEEMIEDQLGTSSDFPQASSLNGTNVHSRSRDAAGSHLLLDAANLLLKGLVVVRHRWSDQAFGERDDIGIEHVASALSGDCGAAE